MYVEVISLQHFRNYTQRTFFFTKNTTVFIGHNAAGKTSVIEAISLLTTGESFRAEKIEEMISFGQEIGRVKGKIKNGEETELEVTLTRGVVQQRKTQTRLYAVNNVRRLKKNFVGNFFTVTFRPEDMRLIEGSPSRRRQFIDTLLSMTDKEYMQSLKTYEEALKRRNRFLQQIREGLMQRSVLTYWTDLIVKHGQIVQEKRRQLFTFFPTVQFPFLLEIQYLPSVMSESRIQEYAEREIAAGHTLIGPHKDDFEVELKIDSHSLNIAAYGSRGQQRLAVLWLKTCELSYMQQQTGIQPVLLLDDILSELDAEHRQDVFSLLQRGQSIVTTTEERMKDEIEKYMGDIEIISL